MRSTCASATTRTSAHTRPRDKSGAERRHVRETYAFSPEGEPYRVVSSALWPTRLRYVLDVAARDGEQISVLIYAAPQRAH